MNKIMLIGNLTFDPELRTTPNGVPVCSFNIAVNRRFASANSERVTDFFRIVAWRQLGENCAKYLQKGKKVAVMGELQARMYDTKDGEKRMALEVSADEVEFLTPRGEAYDGEPSGAATARFAPKFAPAAARNDVPDAGFTDIDEDDLPF